MMVAAFSLMTTTMKMKSSLLILCLELINLTHRWQNLTTLGIRNPNHLYKNQLHEEDHHREIQECQIKLDLE